jgi:hypothetical protein
MSMDIKETLDKLHSGDPSLLSMQKRLLHSIGQPITDSDSLRALLDELQKRYQLPSCQNFHNQAFYAALIGSTHFFMEEHQDAANWFQTAECQFRNQGEVWNQCITLKILGLAYLSSAEQYQAICAFEKAQHLLSQEIRLNKNEYSLDYQEQISDLDELIKQARQIAVKSKKAPQPGIHASRKFNQANPAWSPARIIYSVRDFGHANQNPEFDMGDEQISEMSIDAISFDGISHMVYNLRRGAGNQIKLNSSGNYRWLKVAGHSMNRADPIPLEPGDYVLADLDQEPQIGNIVIANLHNPPTPAERAGVVKRYLRKGLKSESIEQIDPIPLTDADIRGVVIAVAKNSTEPGSPPSPEELQLYQSLLGMLAGNRSAADRLINYERDCAPEENRTMFIKEAIRRLQRERHSA